MPKRLKNLGSADSSSSKMLALDRATRLWELKSKSATNLDVEDAVNSRRVLALQKRNRHVMYRNATGSLAIGPAMMRVAVDRQLGSMTVNHFSQP